MQALADGRQHPNRGIGIGRYRAGRPRPDLRGENNPNWKGGTYGTIRHTEMGRAAYKTWRLAVFKRDGFSCVMCGANGVRFQAHHVRPWRAYPDLWFEVTNGVTLCGPCHRAIGDEEHLFADRFEARTRTAAPVTLTAEERARFIPYLMSCNACGNELRRPRHHRRNNLHFCDIACKRSFERAIGGDWRNYAAGKIIPSLPSSGQQPAH